MLNREGLWNSAPRSNGLTQEELADRCELTKGYISQLENELTSPSIQTLLDVLSALGTTAAEFFAEEEEEQVVFTRDDFFEKDAEEHVITWLVPNSQRNEMEPILITVHPGAASVKDMPHEGEEFGFVLDGTVKLRYGEKTYVCRKGDSFYFTADKAHNIKNVSERDAVFIWVSSPPNF